MADLILKRAEMVYCGECGLPCEYCEYQADYETVCRIWLNKHHPEFLQNNKESTSSKPKKEKPSEPWTTEERLTQFYQKYQPDKLDGIPKILTKYAGKEDKLFEALCKKYGPEPEDPYYADSDEEDDDDSGDSDDDIKKGMADLSVSKKKKKVKSSNKKSSKKVDTRVVIQKVLRNKRKAVTIIAGMDTIPDIKLKDVSKAFSKRFAGSSSVKDTPAGKKEIIIQGDHMDDVAAMIVNKFKVPGNSVFMDIDGEFVPFSD